MMPCVYHYHTHMHLCIHACKTHLKNKLIRQKVNTGKQRKIENYPVIKMRIYNYIRIFLISFNFSAINCLNDTLKQKAH